MGRSGTRPPEHLHIKSQGPSQLSHSLCVSELLIPQRSLDLMCNCNSISVVQVHDSVFGPKYPIVEQFQRNKNYLMTASI